MNASAAWLAALLLGSAAQAHELDFPLLAPAGEAVTGSNLGARPRQPPGQTLPLKTTRRISFDTDEGTWMSLDVAPDGQHIVFDLLGDLYTLDATGGSARALTHGLPFDTQPTYSPDGEWLAYVSDRSGAENVWIMRTDGSQAHQVSFGDDDTVLVSPAWSADGRAVFVSRFLWSVDGYELWRYGLDGTESLIVPVKPVGAPRDSGVSTLGAVATADGRQLYFARRVGTADGGVKLDRWSIVRRDLESGEETTVVPDQGTANGIASYFRPALSGDGKLLAYGTRFHGQTGLRLRNLDTGEDRWLIYPIEHDQIQARSWQDLIPRYAFSSDSHSLLLSRNGRFERIAVDEQGAASPIPFHAAIDLQLGPLTRVDVRQESGALRARLIQTPQQSPDGHTLAFSSLGRLYLMPLERGAMPHRLTSSTVPEFHPSWSADNKSLAYVSWSAKDSGAVWIVPAAGGVARRISEQSDFYSHPVFTPDGTSLLAIRSSNEARLQRVMDFGFSRSSLICWPLSGGPSRVIYSGLFGGQPHFSARPGTVYVQSAQGLLPIDLASGVAGEPTQLKGPGWYFLEGSVPVDDVRISPDGHYMLAFVAQQLHLIAAPAAGATVDLSEPHLPHRRITSGGADFFNWADGGRTITWSVGSTFYRRALKDVHLNAAEQPNWLADAPQVPSSRSFAALVSVPRDDPRGSLLLRGARIITMRGDEVLERGEVLIRNGRIAAVGALGSLQVPAQTEIRELPGRTILPGFIDVHDHVADIRRDVIAMESWGLRARLAYGVTTSFDPSSLSIDMFAYEDLSDAGVLIGARIPTTGMALFSYNRLSSLSDARAILMRYRDHYRTRNIKQYLIGNRRQREWLIAAAHELGVMPTTEGSLALKLDLGQIMDGYSGNEHALPTPLYRDVIELVARSKTSYDATLQILNGGPPAQNQFVVRDHPLGDAKFMRLRPYDVAERSVGTREWSDPSALLYPRIAGDAARIQRAGGVVGIGSHGEIPGLGFHWELEAHVQGGMTPLEALRAGTIGSAETIGRAREFGSIEAGKFADLVILDADPRNDIRLSREVALVMKNGRLYDAATLEEIWPDRKALDAPWFAHQAPQ